MPKSYDPKKHLGVIVPRHGGTIYLDLTPKDPYDRQNVGPLDRSKYNIGPYSGPMPVQRPGPDLTHTTTIQGAALGETPTTTRPGFRSSELDPIEPMDEARLEKARLAFADFSDEYIRRALADITENISAWDMEPEARRAYVERGVKLGINISPKLLRASGVTDPRAKPTSKPEGDIEKELDTTVRGDAVREKDPYAGYATIRPGGDPIDGPEYRPETTNGGGPLARPLELDQQFNNAVNIIVKHYTEHGWSGSDDMVGELEQLLITVLENEGIKYGNREIFEAMGSMLSQLGSVDSRVMDLEGADAYSGSFVDWERDRIDLTVDDGPEIDYSSYGGIPTGYTKSPIPGAPPSGRGGQEVTRGEGPDIDVTQLPGYEEYRQFEGESTYADVGGVFDPALGRGVQNRKDAEAVFRWARGIAIGVFQDPRTGGWLKDGIPTTDEDRDEIILAQERDDWLGQAWQVHTASIDSQKAVQDAYNNSLRDNKREALERETTRKNDEHRFRRESELAQAESKAASLELRARHAREDESAKEEHDRRLDIIDQGHINNLALTERQHESSSLLLQRQFDIQYEMTTLEQQFKGEQANLDRSLEAANLIEARRASKSLEGLRQQEVDIQQRRVALDTFNSISQNPAMLYFAQQTGMLSQLGDIFGDGGDTLQGIMADIQESPANENIQEFARLSSFDQTINQFKLGAQQGVATKDVPGTLRGPSPGGRGILRPVPLDAPIQPGSASGGPFLGGPKLPSVGMELDVRTGDGGAVNPQKIPKSVPNPYGTVGIQGGF
jgi:hypothetical protein